MTKRQIEERIDYWKRKMGLDNWRFSIQYKATVSQYDSDDFVALAGVVCQPRYKLATITFDPKGLDQVTDTVIVHELYHVLTAPVMNWMENRIGNDEQDELDYFKEQLVSEMERITMRIYERKK